MAIRIEQPGPFAPGLSAAYGAAEVMNQNSPAIANLYADTARMTMARSEARADRDFQAREAAAERAFRGGHLNADRDARMADANANRTQEAAALQQRGAFDDAQLGLAYADLRQEGNFRNAQLVQNYDLAERRFSHQMALQDQELTQAEVNRLNQLKAAKARVASEPGLSDEEKNALYFQLDTGINPLQQRLARSRQMAEMEQIKKEQEQSARLATIQNINEEYRAKGFPGRVLTFQDPLTGQPMSGWMDDKGNFNPFGGKGGSAASDPMDDLKAEAAAAKAAREIADARFPLSATDPERNMLENRTVFEEEFNRMVGPHRQRSAGRTQPPAAGQPQPTQQQPRQQPQPAPVAEPPKPFKLDDRKSMSPVQETVVNTTDKAISDLSRRTDLPPEAREMGTRALTKMKELFARAGSFHTMTEEQRAEFNILEAAYRSIPAGSPQPGQPTARDISAAAPHIADMLRPSAQQSALNFLSGGR